MDESGKREDGFKGYGFRAKYFRVRGIGLKRQERKG